MKYYNYISGGMTPDHLLAACTIWILGLACYKVLTGMLRDRKSQRLPGAWSWAVWWRDNRSELWQNAVLMLAFIRFASEIIARTVPNAAEWIKSNDPMWLYFFAGLAKAYIINVIRKKKLAKK